MDTTAEGRSTGEVREGNCATCLTSDSDGWRMKRAEGCVRLGESLVCGFLSGGRSTGEVREGDCATCLTSDIDGWRMERAEGCVRQR